MPKQQQYPAGDSKLPASTSSLGFEQIEMLSPEITPPSRSGAPRSGTVEEVAEIDEPLPLVPALRRFSKVAGYCLAMSVAIIGWGYDLVVVGSIVSVDSFLRDYGDLYEGDLIIPSSWLSLWLGLPPVGRTTLMIGSTISAVAVSFIFFSHLASDQTNRRVILTVGLTVQGLSVGMIKTTAVTYVSENAPTCLRGPAMVLFPTFTLLGQLVGAIVVFVVNGVEGPTGYLGAFGSQWVLALAPFILACLMPESPAYLVRKGYEERALKAATALYAPKVDPRGALVRIRAIIEEERAMKTEASYRACFQGTNRRRTMIVLLAYAMPTLFGLDLLSNASYFLKTLGMPSGQALLTMIGGIVAGILANAVGIWVASRARRRRMALLSLSATVALWTAMGASGFRPSGATPWLAAGLMVGVILVCGVGCWPASYVIAGETSALVLRAPTQGLGGCVTHVSSAAAAIALPYIFNPDAGALGARSGLVYSGLCALALAATWVGVPELQGRSMLEIDHMFELRLATRKFGGWGR
ncbi:general substrate transporter [Apiospora kogelbergensis]|uniref:General substrate transporter n=1 Tax=Apiospora kogelbergensis TaxID=1337665 RepID=A0AAW0QE02_9PEZI